MNVASLHPPLARLSSVRKRFGPTIAVDGIDLVVHGDELLAVLGPNGAGNRVEAYRLARQKGWL